MTTRIHHMYDCFVECKKRTYYKPEKKWRVLVDDKIIAKIPATDIDRYVKNLRERIRRHQRA